MAIVMLGPEDVGRIVELERRSFIPELQASRETILRRFELGHLMFGLEEEGQLVGMHCVSYGWFDPDDFEAFPKTEQAYCMQPVPSQFNAFYSYNLEVAPTSRGRAHSDLLFRATVERAIQDGCEFGVGCSRIPSYAGSHPESRHERFEHNPAFRAAIDRHLQGGDYPDHDRMLLDPLLKLYFHLGGQGRRRFHWIIPGFAPTDHASGGIRVIIYGLLQDWPNTRTLSD